MLLVFLEVLEILVFLGVLGGFIRPYSIASFYHIILEYRSDTKEASNAESIY